MTDQQGQAADEESPAMRDFLAKRRVEVLDRAVVTLESCSDDDLGAEAHRLAGTLGIFGFDEASLRMRELMRTAQDPDIAPDAVSDARANALDYLRGIHSTTAERDPG